MDIADLTAETEVARRAQRLNDGIKSTNFSLRALCVFSLRLCG